MEIHRTVVASEAILDLHEQHFIRGSVHMDDSCGQIFFHQRVAAYDAIFELHYFIRVYINMLDLHFICVSVYYETGSARRFFTGSTRTLSSGVRRSLGDIGYT